ncbi:MAG TPA: tetratricopeptide repeat protein, partial [Ktedonobacterales bacterium]
LCEATLQAEAVARTGADAPGPPAMIRLLGRLVDDSLVQVEDADEQIRYRFLEPVRQYAQAKLLESGEQERLRAAHAQWCAALAGEGDTPFRAMSQVEQSRWLQTMDAELANLRAALHWARQHEHAEIGLRLAVALEPYWYRRGMLREASSWLEELLALPASQQARLRPAAVYSASVFALQRADWTSARRLAAEGVALCRDRGDTLGMLRTLTVLGGSAELAGDYGEARRYYEQCLELARWIGDVPREIVSLSNMADVAIAQGDAEGAAKLYRQCLVLARSADHTRLMGMALTNLGKVALSRGQIDQAAEYLHEGLLHMRKLEEARGIAEVLVPLGQLALIRGDEQEALARTVEAFEWYFHAGMQVGIAQALEALARIAIAAEAWEWAIQLLSAASALRECADLPPTVTEQRERERSVERVVRHFTGEAFAVATAQGRTRPLGEIVAELTRHARRWPSHWHRSAKNSPTGDAKNTDPLGRLTKRQREVAELVAQRLTDREIAERLALEKRTIETHVHHIFSQLHLHSRAELAAYMRERRMATVRADAQ